MSDEETECRLSYSEGRRIKKEVEKPYVSAIAYCLVPTGAIVVACIAAEIAEFFVSPPLGAGLTHLVDTGQITEEVALYFSGMNRTNGFLMMILSSMVTFLTAMYGIKKFSEEAVKKALKEENEKRVSE